MGAIIKFPDTPPELVSAGHDGFDPYNLFPFDSVFVQAFRYSKKADDQFVVFWLPYLKEIIWHQAEIHRSGFLWHDRLRDISPAYMRLGRPVWLSCFGFTSQDPRLLKDEHPVVFAELPGSPMQDELQSLWGSTKWRQIMEFHTRKRDWMPAAKFSLHDSKRYERDSALIAKLKARRGASCQICGFSFRKADGTDYSEIHHLDGLASGGLDVEANCLVLCANCHRQFHYGNVKIIAHTHNLLIVEIDGHAHRCPML